MVLSSMQLQKVSVTLWFRRLQCLVPRAVLSVFIYLHSAECVCSYYGLRVCSQTNKLNKLKYLGYILDTHLSDDEDIQRQQRYQYCAANKLRASSSRCSNTVTNGLFLSLCRPMYASQLWCNFRKSCMQRLRVAYNFGCRALYNLPGRASVSSHQVHCNSPTFEALIRNYKYLFLERCRKSNNIRLRALMQSDCLYSSQFFEHYNRILLCEWVLEHCSVFDWWRVMSHAFALYLDLTSSGVGALICSSVSTSVTC